MRCEKLFTHVGSRASVVSLVESGEQRYIKAINNYTSRLVSRFGLAVSVRLVSRGTSVRIRFGSPFTSKVVVCGHSLVTLSLTINETLKLNAGVILVVTV